MSTKHKTIFEYHFNKALKLAKKRDAKKDTMSKSEQNELGIQIRTHILDAFLNI